MVGGKKRMAADVLVAGPSHSSTLMTSCHAVSAKILGLLQVVWVGLGAGLQLHSGSDPNPQCLAYVMTGFGLRQKFSMYAREAGQLTKAYTGLPKELLSRTTLHSPTLTRSRPCPIFKMVQYYSILGKQVGSHYVSPALPPPHSSSNGPVSSLQDTTNEPRGTRDTDTSPIFPARHCHPDDAFRRQLRLCRRRRQKDHCHSPDQRFHPRRGRLHQVHNTPTPPALRARGTRTLILSYRQFMEQAEADVKSKAKH